MNSTLEVGAGRCSVDRLVRHLPSEEGFFWWRENASKAWRMVQVVDFASGVEDKSHLIRTTAIYAHPEVERARQIIDAQPNPQPVPALQLVAA